MNVLVSGGCKNGKSGFAQQTAMELAVGGPRYYVATMIPSDREDRERIARHIRNREGLGFETLEVGRRIEDCLTLAAPDATFLVDSVTALLLNELFCDPAGEQADPKAVKRCREGMKKLMAGAKNVVFVSDYIYSDAFRYDAYTELYRASLAALDRFLAQTCDTVAELCAGRVIYHKGGLPV